MNTPENKWIRNGAILVLILVGFVGFALSFETLWQAAIPAFGPLALGFPLLADLMIVGCLLQYIRTARMNAPMNGWRLAAHAGVAGTIFLNIVASPVHLIPWHVVPPVVWSVLCELVARQVLGQYKRTLNAPAEHISLRLWFTAPKQSAQAWLRRARVNAGESWVSVAVLSDARSCVNACVADPAVRRVLKRQLRAGSLAPGDVLSVVGWHPGATDQPTPEEALRAALSLSLARVPGVPTPVSLGIEGPSVPGQGKSLPLEIPAPKATQRAAIETALTRSGGDRTAAMALLDSTGVQYSESYVHRIAREMVNENKKVTALHPR